MFKKFAALAVGIVGLYTLEACVVVGAGGSAGSGGGTGGDTSSSSSGVAGAGVGGMGNAGGAGGKGGAGGAPACVTCSEYITAAAAGELPPPACMGQSQEFAKALSDCTCDMAAGCGVDCGPSQFCTMGGPAPTAECSKCIQTGSCMNQFGACAGDVP